MHYASTFSTFLLNVLNLTPGRMLGPLHARDSYLVDAFGWPAWGSTSVSPNHNLIMCVEIVLIRAKAQGVCDILRWYIKSASLVFRELI